MGLNDIFILDKTHLFRNIIIIIINFKIAIAIRLFFQRVTRYIETNFLHAFAINLKPMIYDVRINTFCLCS